MSLNSGLATKWLLVGRPEEGGWLQCTENPALKRGTTESGLWSLHPVRLALRAGSTGKLDNGMCEHPLQSWQVFCSKVNQPFLSHPPRELREPQERHDQDKLESPESPQQTVTWPRGSPAVWVAHSHLNWTHLHFWEPSWSSSLECQGWFLRASLFSFLMVLGFLWKNKAKQNQSRNFFRKTGLGSYFC